MKKIMKLVILTIIFFALLIVIDMTSIYFRNKPIFAVKESDSIYKGLLYDTYNCPEYSIYQIKFKNTKFECSDLFTFDYDDMYEPGSTFKGKINLNTGESNITVINHSSLPYPNNKPTTKEYSGTFTEGELKQIKEIIDKYDIAEKFNDDYTREFYVTLTEILECKKQTSEVGVEACRKTLELKLNVLLHNSLK